MLELSDIEIAYDGRTVLAVERLALSGADITAIIGHNGSGKSTLMSLLARQIAPQRGSLRLDGRDIAAISQRALAQRIAYLPQRLPDVAGLTVSELARLGRYAWRGALGRWRGEDADAVARALELTGMTPFAGQLADTLSGGERQRAWVAMLLAQESPLLLLDEPTAALDLAHQMELMGLLAGLNREAGRGVIVILHDVNLAARFAGRVIALKEGRIAFDGAPAALMDKATLSGLFGLDIALAAHPGDGRPVAVVA